MSHKRPKRKAESKTTAKSKRGEGSAAVTLIVREGAVRRFERLQRETAGLPATVQWDRRRSDRRASAGAVDEDRRKTDRRRKPPFTWEIADFVVVTSTAGTDEESKE